MKFEWKCREWEWEWQISLDSSASMLIACCGKKRRIKLHQKLSYKTLKLNVSFWIKPTCWDRRPGRRARSVCAGTRAARTRSSSGQGRIEGSRTQPAQTGKVKKPFWPSYISIFYHAGIHRRKLSVFFKVITCDLRVAVSCLKFMTMQALLLLKIDSMKT